MDTYTASNGLTVELIDRDDDGFQKWNIGDNAGTLFTAAEWAALREFFRAEEDERLGRWRWPENPDYIVYPSKLYSTPSDPDVVHVASETNGQGHRARRDDPDYIFGWFSQAARAYFDAHPEPKPAWHDAQPGEVWLLNIDHKNAANEVAWQVATSTEFSRLGLAINKRDERITTARRIWPEVS